MTDRGIFTREHAERLTVRAGKPYRPSNGTEGDIFEESYCQDCKRYGEPCMIFGAMLFHEIGEPGYPPEIVYGDDGQPTCKAFEDPAQ